MLAKDLVSDLSITARYTSATWAWGELPNAELFLTADAQRLFRIVNGALNIARPFTRAPSLPHSLLERHRIIDDLVGQSGCTRVLELAAGLSRRGVTFSEDENIRYVEVDLPHVVAEKRKLLERSVAGRAALARKNLTLVEGDVLTLGFEKMFPHSDAPTFVIAEGLLMYLDANAQSGLFSAVSNYLADVGGTFAFDLVPASEQREPGVVGHVLGQAMKWFTRGGSFVRDARSRHDIVNELRASGFATVDLHEPRISSKVPVQQLVFSCQSAPKK